MISTGDVSEETKVALDMPLMTTAEYVQFLGMR